LARRLREVAASTLRDGRAELSGTLSRVEAEIKALRPDPASIDWDSVRAESILELLDADILKAARAALPGKEWARLQSEADAALAPRRGAMRATSLAETQIALESHLLRRRWGIPRLSLLAED